MRKIFLLAAMLFSVNSFAQTSDYLISKDDENGSVVFKGQISFEDLKKERSFGWMKSGYKPDRKDLDYLKEYLPQYELVIFLGTWCEDSQRLIPEFYRLLVAAGYPLNKVQLYGVDRAKESKNIEHKLYRIEKVPTIIVTKNKAEIGRIVENVKQSPEADLVALISNNVSESVDEKK